MYTIRNMTGIAEEAVFRIAVELSEVILEVFWKDALDNIILEYSLLDTNKQGQLPNAFAEIYTFHLPIKCPIDGALISESVLNLKTFIVLLAHSCPAM